MLAIKECLMREGVFSNHQHSNNNSSNSNNNNNRNHNDHKQQLQRGGSNMDLLQYQKTIASQSVDFVNNSKTSSSNLSSTSATANTSCQQHQQQPKSSSQFNNNSNNSNIKPTTRYHGQHPHFRHHTAPAYYTDVHLRIHTPDAADVAALNENYRSVYDTPSKLLAGEHYFPKSSTATVAPPPIAGPTSSPKTPTQRSAFFRGAFVGDEQQRKSSEPYVKSSTSCVNPTKGDLNTTIPVTETTPEGSVVFGCINFKPSTGSLDTLELVLGAGNEVAATPSPRVGRNTQRFSNRKRAVRVRSESRPISALYDIICKEKGLDNGASTTTTTNDEDSSSSAAAADSLGNDNSYKNRDKDKDDRHKSKKLNSVSKNCSMSVNSVESPSFVGNNNNNLEHSKRSAHARLLQKYAKKRTRPESASITNNSPVISDLNTDNDDDDSAEEQSVVLTVNVTPKSANSKKSGIKKKSSQKKASSLPPFRVASDTFTKYPLQEQEQQHQHLHHKQQQPKPTLNHHLHHQLLQQYAKNDPASSASNTHNHHTSDSFHSIHSLNHSQHLLSNSPATARDASFTALPRGISSSLLIDQRDLNLHPSKLYIEPVKLPQAEHSEPANRADRMLRSTGAQRRLNEEPCRNADGAASMIPGPSAASAGAADYHSSDGEQLSGSLNGLSQTSSARRFITRPNRTPSRGRSGGLEGGIPSPQRSDSSSPQRFSPVSSTTILAEPLALPVITNGKHKKRGSNVAGTHNFVCPLVISSPAATSLSTPGMTNSAAPATAACSSAETTTTERAAAPTVISEMPALKTAAATTTITPRKLKKMPLSPLNITPTHQQKQPQHFGEPTQQQQQHLPQYSPLLGAPTSPQSPTVHVVRTTKTSRLRAAALDKKKDEEQQQLQQRNSTPTSPRHQHQALQSPCHLITKKSSTRRHSSSSDNPQKSPTGASSADSDNKNSSPSHRSRTSAVGTETSAIPTKKLVPAMSVQMKQNLNEIYYTGGTSVTSPRKRHTLTPLSPKQRPQTTECTVRLSAGSPKKSATKQNTSCSEELLEDFADSRPRSSTMQSEESRNSSSKSTSAHSKESAKELSSMQHKSRTPETLPRQLEDRDKSSKRKSNLNRSLNEEATQDGDESAALRRRRRRELGMARPLIPNDDAAVRELISPQKSATNSPPTNSLTFVAPSPRLPPQQRNDIAYHMENARRGLDLVSPTTPQNERRRAQTASPKIVESARTTSKSASQKLISKPEVSKHPSSVTRLATRRSDTLPLGCVEQRKQRSNDVNRKLNERTKSDLAEIMKIAQIADEEQPVLVESVSAASLRENDSKSPHSYDAVADLTHSMNRIHASHERELVTPESTTTEAVAAPSTPSPVKHATFVLESNTHYYDDSDLPVSDNYCTNLSPSPSSSNLYRQRMLKARSVEREDNPKRYSPVMRRKSTADLPSPPPSANSVAHSSTNGPTSAHNHIVSILKKNPGESSSASSNASPVTFSASVMDTPTKQKRVGILKKRSSLDESRYYSRSHSPDERSILIKSARRNSLEETAAAAAASGQQHGILKQSSYDSCKSDGCPSASESHPHGILKKKDSTSTPSDGGSHAPKHVSISQAVILAAAELCKDSASETALGEYDDSCFTPGNEECDLRPILKLESTSSDDPIRHPKPILKKKSSSGDSDELEIRPILKTSRKSSREEFDISGSHSSDEARQLNSEHSMRPILKSDSPSKRRSLGGSDIDALPGSQLSLLQRRTRSLERTGEMPAVGVATPPQQPIMDLAAALNAIGPQSTSTPVELSAKPNVVSVADRIRNMEKFLHTSLSSTPPTMSSPTHFDGTPHGEAAAAAAINTSWESPLQSVGAVPKLYRPSAIKREFYRDRYKTQPVTSEEKNILKTTSSPFDINNARPSIVATSSPGAAAAAGTPPSAFKPTKSLDALNYVAYANLNSLPPAPPPRPTALTRSATQPLEQLVSPSTPPTRISVVGGTDLLPRSFSGTANTPYRARLHSTNNSNTTTSANDFSDQLTPLSLGSEHERIFDMSGFGDENTSMLVNVSNSVSEDTTHSARMKGGESEGNTNEVNQQTPSSIVRTNSVRARANMFAQMQKSEGIAANSREERTSPRRAPRRLSPAPASYNDEPKTPNNLPANPDEEIEPSSLPLSERLRFFSNLGSANRNSYMSNVRSSPTQYHSYNGVIERSASASTYSSSYFEPNTPRRSLSTTSGSSASVTPTPMEISLGTTDIEEVDDDDADSTSNSTSVRSSDTHSVNSSGEPLKTATAFMQLNNQVKTRALDCATTPTTTQTPTAKRIKLKTIGKLMLPQTFLRANDRNNNKNILSNHSAADASDNNCSDASDKHFAKKIGKIKSPFIENCQQLQQKQQQLNSKCMKYDLRSTPSYSHVHASANDSDTGTNMKQNGDHGDSNDNDLGKENILIMSCANKSAAPPVVEMRKKFTRIMSGSNITNATASMSRLQQKDAPLRNTFSGTSPIIDEKYAKYFGLSPGSAASMAAAAAAKHEGDVKHSAVSVNIVRRNMLNIGDRKNSKPQLITQRHLDVDELMPDASPMQQPMAAAVNHNVRLQPSITSFEQSNASSTSLRRRDVAGKRGRAMTAIVNGTPPSTPVCTPGAGAGVGVGSAGRATRAGRALTITHGVQYGPEVQKFEDITVTKEEFLLASKEFERIFTGIA